MKILIKFISVVVLSTCFSAISLCQAVKVNSAGKVGISCEPDPNYNIKVNGTSYFTNDARMTRLGINTAASSSYNLYVNGVSKIKGRADIYCGNWNPETAHFIFGGEGYYGVCSLAPDVNYGGWIGLSNRAMSEVWSYHHYTPSDARQKENIRDIENPLDIVLNLKGVKYDIKKEYAFDVSKIEDQKIKEKLDEKRKNDIGCIAQDMFRVLPEAVVYDDSTDVYGIDYSKVVAVLVEAIKSQQQQLEEFEQRLNSQLKSAEEITGDLTGNKAVLEQNIPNPFDVDTEINYYLPKTTTNAVIYIYNMNGEQIKAYTLHDKGKGSITINESEFTAGMYMYTLIANGKEIDTKRMILTE